MHPYMEYVNPHLGKLLKDIKLDKEYVKGEGCYLYDSKGVRYLDCIAAYGALPFGYNHPEIWQCIERFQESMEPSFIQPSALNAAGELAKRLIEIAPQGLKYVTFTNSGAESVEAALKLCRSRTGRLGILTTNNSFHGKTMGALSATGNYDYQKVFGAPMAGFTHIDYGVIEQLEAELAKNPDQYAAFIVEPIQGEGGIVQPPAGYLQRVREICTRYGVLLILDEIQTGLGRTGRLFACEEAELTPDVLVIAKALGGGIVPIGACLCTADVYNEDFAHKHSSTFAGNGLVCRIGLQVLEILTRNDGEILKQITVNGDYLKKGLLTLQKKYPQIIKSIRGEGLMLGIEFGVDRNTFPGSMLGIIAEQNLLTQIISSYLLNNQKLRVAPTLNGNHVIRIEPPLIINQDQCQTCIDKIGEMLEVLSEGNTAKFVAYLLDIPKTRDFPPMSPEDDLESILPTNAEEEGRFAFLVHPLDMKSYSDFDESLGAFTEEELTRLINRWDSMLEPFVVSKARIVSQTGKQAFGEFIVVPKTARQLINMPKKEVLKELKLALQLAKERGAQIVGLGAFTSVVSMGGLYLKDEGIPLTTGNSYTVVSAVDATIEAFQRLEISPATATAAIVGATGSIGKGLAMLLAEKVARLVLIGNPANQQSSMRRLFSIAGDIYRYLSVLDNAGEEFLPATLGQRLKSERNLPDFDASPKDFANFAQEINGENSPILVTTAIDEYLAVADVIICATNSLDELITPNNLKAGAIVCDISRPGNVSRQVESLRPDVLVIDGGVIGIPGRPSLGWNFGFEEGLAYACMAETMILALEQHYTHMSIGSSGINLENILFLKQLAEKHGFEITDLRSFDKPLCPEKWQQVKEAKLQTIGSN